MLETAFLSQNSLAISAPIWLHVPRLWAAALTAVPLASCRICIMVSQHLDDHGVERQGPRLVRAQ